MADEQSSEQLAQEAVSVEAVQPIMGGGGGGKKKKRAKKKAAAAAAAAGEQAAAAATPAQTEKDEVSFELSRVYEYLEDFVGIATPRW